MEFNVLVTGRERSATAIYNYVNTNFECYYITGWSTIIKPDWHPTQF